MTHKIFSIKNIPNGLSLLRLLSILPFIISIHDIFMYECLNNGALLFAFTVIITSDIADGFLARKLNCATNIGAKLDILADTLYTMLSLSAFAYFDIIPVWFILIMVLKLLEFIITSKIITSKQKSGTIVFFDKLGKISISIVMLLPGIFVFRCIIIDYKIVMNIVIYIVTALLTTSFFSRILYVLKTHRQCV